MNIYKIWSSPIQFIASLLSFKWFQRNALMVQWCLEIKPQQNILYHYWHKKPQDIRLIYFSYLKTSWLWYVSSTDMTQIVFLMRECKICKRSKKYRHTHLYNPTSNKYLMQSTIYHWKYYNDYRLKVCWYFSGYYG